MQKMPNVEDLDMFYIIEKKFVLESKYFFFKLFRNALSAGKKY